MDSNRTPILFIAPNFPPIGGVGVQRSIGFVRHLRKFNYEPIVLTVSEEEMIQNNEKRDDKVYEDFVREGYEIIRVPSRQPYKLIKLLMKLKLFRIAWFLFYPFFMEKSTRWSRTALPEALKLIDKYNIKTIYSSAAPYVAIDLAIKIKDNANVSWVADFRDPFTEHFGWHWPSKLHWWYCRLLEKKWMEKADKVIVVTNEMKEMYLNRGIVSRDKITVITNGYS